MSIDELQRDFDRRRSEFLAEHEFQWAVLFSNGDAGFFDDEMDAVNAGFDDRRGLEFTVKQVLAEDRPIHLSSISLADLQ